MNKYASGYTFISAIYVIGWVLVALSLVGGFVIGANAPTGLGFLGWIVAVAGLFQGVVLLGMSAIGKAVLDGSLALQGIYGKGVGANVSNKSNPSSRPSGAAKIKNEDQDLGWDSVSRVEHLASSGKINDAKNQARKIVDLSQRAWAFAAIAEIQYDANDVEGASNSAEEAISSAKSIEDKDAREIAFDAISNSVSKYIL